MNAFLGTCLIILPSFTYHWSESTLLLKHTSAVLQYKKYWCSALYYPAHWEWVVYLASGDAGCNVSFWNHKSDLQQVNISSVHKTLNIEHIVFPNRTKFDTALPWAIQNACAIHIHTERHTLVELVDDYQLTCWLFCYWII